MRRPLLRLLLLALVLSTASAAAADDEADPAEPEPEAAAETEAAAEPVAEVVLDCKDGGVLARLPGGRLPLPPTWNTACSPRAPELRENKVETWSVDCVALWLDNLGFGAQRQQAAAPRRAPGGSCRAPPLTTDVPCAHS